MESRAPRLSAPLRMCCGWGPKSPLAGPPLPGEIPKPARGAGGRSSLSHGGQDTAQRKALQSGRGWSFRRLDTGAAVVCRRDYLFSTRDTCRGSPTPVSAFTERHWRPQGPRPGGWTWAGVPTPPGLVREPGSASGSLGLSFPVWALRGSTCDPKGPSCLDRSGLLLSALWLGKGRQPMASLLRPRGPTVRPPRYWEQ